MPYLNEDLHLTRALAFVDTEWTDLDPEQRRIVSIAVTRFDPDGTQETRYWLVNPMRPISRQSTDIHGIQPEDVAQQPEFRAIASDVEEILKNADIAGYGVTNDIEIIEKEMAAAGKNWTAAGRKIIDAYRLCQVREPRTLSDAHRRFVGPVPEDAPAHDARHDVSMTIAIVKAMQDGKTVPQMHEEAHPNMIDPAGKFRRENGQPVYNFGPYRGLPVAEYPEYLEWMLTKSFAPSTMHAARALLQESYSEPPGRWPLDEYIDQEYDDP